MILNSDLKGKHKGVLNNLNLTRFKCDKYLIIIFSINCQIRNLH